jgi:nicotinate-nucleotide--dimethylbenzimidazole phosphoribosyltransferase
MEPAPLAARAAETEPVYVPEHVVAATSTAEAPIAFAPQQMPEPAPQREPESPWAPPPAAVFSQPEQAEPRRSRHAAPDDAPVPAGAQQPEDIAVQRMWAPTADPAPAYAPMPSVEAPAPESAEPAAAYLPVPDPVFAPPEPAQRFAEPVQQPVVAPEPPAVPEAEAATSVEDLLAAYGLTTSPRRRRRD